TDLKMSVEQSIAVFIAVGTPPSADGSANLDFVFGVAHEVAQHINGYKIIVTKSTVPVGTGRNVYKIISEQLDKRTGEEYLNTHPESNGRKISFDVVSNPEFLREGSAIGDFMRPDRVVIGAESDSAVAIMEDIYRPLYLFETPMVTTNIETSELIKYAANAFLATKISFINEMGHLCERLGGNIDDLAKGMGLDKRIGNKFLHVSPGYGGSCFPKDTMAVVDIAKKVGFDLKVVTAALEANIRQKEMMVDKIEAAMGGSVKGKTVGILGLAFKPNTDDMREAASITIINKLQEKGATVQAFDPVAMEAAKKEISNVNYKEDAYSVADGADALVILTEWNEFRMMDLEKIKKLLNAPVFVDLRNIYDHKKMEALGIVYTSLGHGRLPSVK
ncbi:MAG: UDPglucose 6-dehydrogenase, partial [Candidatus Omnitrophota bacterium]